MYCKQCGTQIEESAINCSSCGRPVKEPMQLNDTLSIISLVCGILSLFVGGTICPIAAIVCGAIVLNKDRQDKKALIGVLLGAIELVLQIILVAGIIVFYVIMYVTMFLCIFMMPVLSMGF